MAKEERTGGEDLVVAVLYFFEKRERGRDPRQV